MSRSFSIALAALAAVAVIGCGQKKAEPAKDAKKPEPTTPALSKLGIKDDKVGTFAKMWPNGAVAERGDHVWVQYTGRLASGLVFDSNMGEDRDPFMFKLGNQEVIPGWDQGLVGMKPGGERSLEIPSKLAYGPNSPSEDIPPNSDLYFKVKMLDIVKRGDEHVFDTRELKKGTGADVKANSTVTVHYEGFLVDGRAFDSSRRRKKPITLKLGTDTVQPLALEKAIVGMKKGGIRAIRIPPEIGLPAGERIPTDSLQYFFVEVLDVK